MAMPMGSCSIRGMVDVHRVVAAAHHIAADVLDTAADCAASSRAPTTETPAAAKLQIGRGHCGMTNETKATELSDGKQNVAKEKRRTSWGTARLHGKAVGVRSSLHWFFTQELALQRYRDKFNVCHDGACRVRLPNTISQAITWLRDALTVSGCFSAICEGMCHLVSNIRDINVTVRAVAAPLEFGLVRLPVGTRAATSDIQPLRVPLLSSASTRNRTATCLAQVVANASSCRVKQTRREESLQLSVSRQPRVKSTAGRHLMDEVFLSVWR